MVFGGVEKERLQLNEITVWSGSLEQNADKPEAYKSLPAIRQLIAEGKYADAGKHVSAEFGFARRAAVSATILTAPTRRLGDLQFRVSRARLALMTNIGAGSISAKRLRASPWQSGGDTWTRESSPLPRIRRL